MENKAKYLVPGDYMADPAVHAYDHAWLDAAKKWLRLSFKTKANGSSAESN